MTRRVPSGTLQEGRGPGRGALVRSAPAWLLAAAWILWAGASGAVLAEGGVSHVRVGSGVATSPSRRCGACHSPEFSLWVRHPHSHFLIDPSRDPRLVKARWDGRAPGWAGNVQGRFDRSDVALAFGVLQIQVYFRRTPEGHLLLPAQWNLRERRWEPLPPALQAVARDRIPWEEACAGCHTTGYDPVKRAFSEPNVGCSACHGPGEAHARSGGRKPILRPSELAPLARAALCGACHSRGWAPRTGRPYPVGFRPGEPLERSFRLERPDPAGATAYFWPDGTERLPFMEYQGFLQSRHARSGLSCTTCHLPHGSDKPHGLRRRTEELCRGCHGRDLPDTPVHRGHPEGAAGCVDCHMTVVNPADRYMRVRTHTFRFLAPGGPPGRPDSCTASCHADHDPAWAQGAIQGWKGGMRGR